MPIDSNITDTSLNEDYKAGYRLLPGFWLCVAIWPVCLVGHFWFGWLTLQDYFTLKNSGLPEYASLVSNVQPRIVFMLIWPIVALVAHCIYFSRIWNIVKDESLLITPANMQFLSEEILVRCVEWKDVTALRYLNISKGARHIRIYTTNDAITLPRYVLYDDTETINLIRKYAQLTEEQVGLVWIRCKRSNDSAIPAPTS